MIKTAYFVFLFFGISFQSHWALAQMSPSDQYCGYLENLQERAYQSTEKPSNLENLINFVNSLIQKVSLDKLENEAITKKMTFEEFKNWAQTAHSIKVADHYKSKYLEKYILQVCGTLTHTTTFGSEANPELQIAAEKQFNPEGHPYSNELPLKKVEENLPSPIGNDQSKLGITPTPLPTLTPDKKK